MSTSNAPTGPVVFPLLPPELCAALLRQAQEIASQAGRVFGMTGMGAVDHGQYIASERYLDLQPPMHWPHPWLLHALDRAGAGLNTGPSRLHEQPRLLTYRQGAHFGWHTDTIKSPLMPARKLTISIALSGPNDYEGGELEVMAGGETVAPAIPRGSAVAFLPEWRHRVKPVTSGTREVLIVWGY